MLVRRLRFEGLRILEPLELEPGPGWNCLVGPNGAGKTSILEGLYLLGHGRSFRRGGAEALIARGARQLSVFAEIELSGRRHQIGFSRTAREWQARIDAQPAENLGRLFQHAPVVCFEPDSHDLISGPADERRRYLDWGLFHVEPDFLPVWRRYQRALRQRNALLKQGGGDSELRVWGQELAQHGEDLHGLRQAYVDALQPEVAATTEALLPELGAAGLRYRPGWRSSEVALAEALEASLDRDRQLGNTSVGPHRADLVLSFQQLEGRELLSRGQEKSSALCLRLAQVRLHGARRLDWPLLLLDDLGSELDAEHLQRAMRLIESIPAQRWVSGTSGLEGLDPDSASLFHVEQGRVRRLL